MSRNTAAYEQDSLADFELVATMSLIKTAPIIAQEFDFLELNSTNLLLKTPSYD